MAGWVAGGVEIATIDPILGDSSRYSPSSPYTPIYPHIRPYTPIYPLDISIAVFDPLSHGHDPVGADLSVRRVFRTSLQSPVIIVVLCTVSSNQSYTSALHRLQSSVIIGVLCTVSSNQ